MYRLILFLAAFGCAWAQTTLFPTIVEIIEQAAPTQAFPNTAGSTNEFLVTVKTEGVLPAKITVSNQIMTLFAFRGIPPGAKDCSLYANLPENYPVWQYAAYPPGGISESLTPNLIYRGLDTSLFNSPGTWTWDSVVNGGKIFNIGPQGEYGGFFYNNWRDPVTDGNCPGISGPWGGEVGYAISMSTEYSSGYVFMNQQYVYGNLSETAGVYMTYIY